MIRLRIFLLAVLVFGVGYGATSVVAQVGAALYKNSATGRSYPQQISAGYLATADGGVVNVMGSPAPTAVGQALRSTTTGTKASASWTSDPDGGVYSGGGTTNYIPKWTGDHTLGNSTLWESSAYMYRQRLNSNVLAWESYGGGTPSLILKASLSGTVGGLTTTTDSLSLGEYRFQGVNTTPAWAYGAIISAVQYGAAGVYVPAKLKLYTYSSSAVNSTQLVLNPDNSISMSGPVSAANLPYCKVGQVHLGGTGTDTSTATATVTSRTCQDPPWTTTPLSSATPPRVVSGPGAAGTATSGVRSDSTFGLSATNPNRGDFLRSPTGTDTATNTSVGWDHATD
ncbi:MAG TPA: hypothetical protein VJ860_06895, partial [Polyangia bacterium]|nr:hypothetical protein [Polyangia bacterium]